MNTFLLICSTFAHNLSSVILLGFYLLLALIFLPVLTRRLQGLALGQFLDDCYRRMLPWIGATLLVFVLSGTYLMLNNPGYHGIGQFTNLWSWAMLIKHALVFVLIGLGVYLNVLIRIGLVKTGPKDAEFATLKPFKLALVLMSLCSVLVLLLTAVAQAQ
jgi:uncharacterized membrane protein